MRNFSCLLIKRIGLFFIAFILFLPAITKAQTTPAADLDSFSSGGTSFYDPNGTNSCGNGADGLITTNVPSVANGGVWQSGLQPPYILEQMAIETLKDIAKKLNVDEKSAVTEEHTIALLAFMNGEGGDIANSYQFNPLNTGINATELISGEHKANGTQSFKSFDAGVEATARTIVRPQYSRLTAILTKQDSKAEDFMTALTYFNRYANNVAWAEASDPKSPLYQPDYYQKRLNLVSQVRNDYKLIAGLVIGTPQLEQPLNIRNDAKIVYHPTSSANSPKVNSSNGVVVTDPCVSSSAGGGVVSHNIAQTAVNLSWPEKWNAAVLATEPTRSGPLTAKPEYLAALKQFNQLGLNAAAGGADCGVFVSTVMRATGADKDYPLSGTGQQVDYVKKHPEKYDVVDSVANTSELRAGDIMIINGSNSGHTFIFVDKQANGNDIASASLNDRMPNLDKAYVSDNRGNYTRARLK